MIFSLRVWCLVSIAFSLHGFCLVSVSRAALAGVWNLLYLVCLAGVWYLLYLVCLAGVWYRYLEQHWPDQLGLDRRPVLEQPHRPHGLRTTRWVLTAISNNMVGYPNMPPPRCLP